MADQRSRLTMDILARVRGTQDVDKLAAAVDRTGDQMDGAAGDAAKLDRAIDDLSDEITRLNRQLLATGDIEVFEKLKDQRTALTVLKRMRAELGNVDHDTKILKRTLGEVFAALPSQVKGVAIAGGAVMAAQLAPLLGAAVGGAVIGGVGAGGLVGGIVSAAQDPQVKAAAVDMVETVRRPFDMMGRDFVAPVIRSLDILGRTGERALSGMSGEIRGLAPVAMQLAVGISGMTSEALPGLRDALKAAQPVLHMLANELPELGDAFGDMLSTISDGSDGAILGLSALLDLVENLLRFTGGAVRAFENTFEVMVGAQERMASVGATAFGWLPGVGHAMRNARDQAREWQGELARATAEAESGGARTEHSFTEISRAAEEATRQIETYRDELRAAADPMFALIRATDRVGDAQRGYNEAVEEHGRSSEQARDANMALAEAAIDLQGAMSEAALAGFDGKLTPAMKRAFEAAGLTEQQLDGVRDEAKKAGEQLEDYRGDYPAEVLLKGAREVQKRLERFLGLTEAISGTHDVHFRVSSSGGGGSFGNIAFQHGGVVKGPPGIDRVPARLTAGEFVVRREAAEQNMDLLRAINSGTAAGGVVPMAAVRHPPPPARAAAGGGKLALTVEAGHGSTVERGAADLVMALIRSGALRLSVVDRRVVVA